MFRNPKFYDYIHKENFALMYLHGLIDDFMYKYGVINSRDFKNDLKFREIGVVMGRMQKPVTLFDLEQDTLFETADLFMHLSHPFFENNKMLNEICRNLLNFFFLRLLSILFITFYKLCRLFLYKFKKNLFF